MFGRKTKQLERELKDLRDKYNNLSERLHQIESDVAPFRIGEISYINYYPYECPDRRPKVTLREAIELLCDHLKLRWTHVSSVPARVELEKVK